MAYCDSPLIICRLSDQNGKILNPYAPGAISISAACSTRTCDGHKSGSMTTRVRISGYVVVYVQGIGLSSPIPFQIEENICIYAPKCAFLDFQVERFDCCAEPVMDGEQLVEIGVDIEIKTIVRACEWMDIALKPYPEPQETEEAPEAPESHEALEAPGPQSPEPEISDYEASEEADAHEAADAPEPTDASEGQESLEPQEAQAENPEASIEAPEPSNEDLKAQTCGKKPTIIHAKRVYDCVCLIARARVVYGLLLRALVQQYNALGDALANDYTNADELTEYGQTGILDPGSVSYFNVFINGVLQPPVNYAMSAGLLELLTDNKPLDLQPITIVYVTFEPLGGNPVSVTNDLYITLSTGAHIYTDADGLVDYDSKNIPSPDSVSFFNLFVNGALQPPSTYTVSAGQLELLTPDVPPVGATIILEFITIKDSGGKLLKAQVYNYNTVSNGGKIYTNLDELTQYGNQGIMNPATVSYLHLYVNGVCQPPVTYSVAPGILTILTDNPPTLGVPITLQFVRVFIE